MLIKVIELSSKNYTFVSVENLILLLTKILNIEKSIRFLFSKKKLILTILSNICTKFRVVFIDKKTN